MKKKYLLSVVYCALSIVVIYFCLINNNQKTFSLTENRTLVSKNDLSNKNFFNGKFQNAFGNLVADQFVGKKYINILGNNYDVFASNLSEKIAFANNETLIKVGKVYRIGDSEYYIDNIFEYNDEQQTALENRIWNFERIYDKYGEKYKMYIYKPSCAEEEKWFDNSYYFSAGQMCWDKFKSRLDGKYSIIKQDFADLDDYKNKHYKTDHHWNNIGAYEGYCDIINVIRKDYDVLNAPYKIKDIKEYDFPFYGSLSLHNGNALGYDRLVAYDIDYEKQFSIYVNWKEVDQLGEKENTFNSEEEYYAYEKYYGENKMITTIINNNVNNDLTILIFGDSFSNCIKEDLAAHFKTTHIIDTRLMYDLDDPYNTTFSLDDFLKDNNVDCILWLQYYKNLYFESTCYLHIDLNY